MTLATSKNDFIISDKRYKKFRKENRETTIRRCPMSNGLATVGRKHPFLQEETSRRTRLREGQLSA